MYADLIELYYHSLFQCFKAYHVLSRIYSQPTHTHTCTMCLNRKSEWFFSFILFFVYFNSFVLHPCWYIVEKFVVSCASFSLCWFFFSLYFALLPCNISTTINAAILWAVHMLWILCMVFIYAKNHWFIDYMSKFNFKLISLINLSCEFSYIFSYKFARDFVFLSLARSLANTVCMCVCD